MNRPFTKHSLAPLTLSVMVLLSATAADAAVVEVMPGHLKPPTKSTFALSTQYFDTRASGRYSSGISNNNESARARSIRLSGYYFDQVDQVPVVYTASTAFERSEGQRTTPALDQKMSGVDDLRLGVGFWPYVDEAKGRYLLLGSVLALPTGKYDPAQTVNIGENRKRITLLAGYATAVSETLSWDSFLLYNRFGSNPNYLNLGKQTQDDSSSFTTYLTQEVAPHTNIYAGLEYIHGSDIYLNGAKAADGQRDLRGYLGGSMPVSRKDILGMRLGKTLRATTGLNEDSQLILSLTHLF
jgi:hypothetical protein